MHEEFGRVLAVYFLGRGFYHIVMERPDLVTKLLQCSPINLKGSVAYLLKWDPSFDPTQALEKGEGLYPVIVTFPNLGQQYLPIVCTIASKLGTVLSDPRKDLGMPAKRILVSSLNGLPRKVMLPKQDVTLLEQRIEYVGLPNQCFFCRKKGTSSKKLQKGRISKSKCPMRHPIKHKTWGRN